ncbi:14386_t:CDS:2, partial [Acaulospora colombiana]
RPTYNVEKLSKDIATPIIDKKIPIPNKKPSNNKKLKITHNPSPAQQISISTNNNLERNKQDSTA